MREVIRRVQRPEDRRNGHRAVRVSFSFVLIVVMVDESLYGPVEVPPDLADGQPGITVAAHHPRQGRVVRFDRERIGEATGG